MALTGEPLHAQFAAPVDLTDPRGGFRDAETLDADGDGDVDLAIGFKNTVTYLKNERLSGGCSSTAAPTGLDATVSAGALLSWTAVPGSVACQVRGKPVTAPAYATLPPVFGTEPASANVPASTASPSGALRANAAITAGCAWPAPPRPNDPCSGLRGRGREAPFA